MAEDSAPVPEGVEPHLATHGKVAYIEIPARDPITSGVFYEAVFGWTLTSVPDDRVSYTLGPSDNQRVPFSDTPTGLIGAFVAARGPSMDGVSLNIYVRDLLATLRDIEGRGCEIVEAPRAEGALRVARFRDPGGNIMGAWEVGAG